MKKRLGSLGTIISCVVLIGITSFVTVLFLQSTKNITAQLKKVPKVLSIADGEPVSLYEGEVYRYTKEGRWEKQEFAEKIEQVISGEYLNLLDAKGALYGNSILAEELFESGYVPNNGAGYIFEMASKALEINGEQPFIMVNGSVMSNFRALTEDNRILYQRSDEYDYYKMDEKVAQLSGDYILTEDGNVYLLKVTEQDAYDKTTGNIVRNYIPELKRVHSNGEIVYINAADTANRCIGLTRKGTAKVFWEDLKAPEVSDWKKLKKVVQGFFFEVGLTQNGQVLLAYEAQDTQKQAEMEKLEKVLSDWKDMVDIEEYYGTIYGLDSDGKIYKSSYTLSQQEISELRKEYPAFDFEDYWYGTNWQPVSAKYLSLDGFLEEIDCYVYVELAGEPESFYRGPKGKEITAEEFDKLSYAKDHYDEKYAYTVSVKEDSSGQFKDGEQFQITFDSETGVYPKLEQGSTFVIPLKYKGADKRYSWSVGESFYVTEEEYILSVYEGEWFLNGEYNGMRINDFLEQIGERIKKVHSVVEK